jgi:XTP/dITP diphosphohydrolase
VKEHKVWFLTSNKGKFREATIVTTKSGLTLRMLPRRKVEIQSDSLAEIATYATKEAASRLRVPIVAEDAGLFIRALSGFPGPYSSDAYKRLGTKGILKLMKNIQRREAKFISVVAFCEPDGSPRYFTGTVTGHISSRHQGVHGFAFDPIFMPRKGDGRTFGQMTLEEKNDMSHRAIAFRKFSKWASANLAGSIPQKKSGPNLAGRLK